MRDPAVIEPARGGPSRRRFLLLGGGAVAVPLTRQLLGALVLAAACALVWSGVATAQQSQTPTELWQE
ncbi:MAG: hypothetical protein ACRDSF_26240, partial [Pseudonocardiaceae bacterium]